ncbi:hypothetical protein ABKV19_002191 [Rosa sericea]
MSTAAGADGLFRCGAYEGCISGSDVGKERRPYHRNCGCALHNRSEKKDRQQQHCTHGGQKSKSVSYPLRRAWSEGHLGLVVASNNSCCSGHSSPSSSPAAAAVRQPQPVRHHRFGSVGSFDRLSAFDEEEEEEDIVFFKV